MTIADSTLAPQLQKEASEERKRGFDNLAPKEEKEEQGREENNLAEIELPFHILGYTPERKVLIWHKGHLMPFSTSQLRWDDLSLLIEEVQRDNIENVKAQILCEARDKGIIDETNPIKVGAWKINDKWLIINGKDYLEVSKEGVKVVEYPVYENRIISFSKKWFNTELFNSKFGKITIADAYNKIHACVSQWYWRDENAASYMSAILLLIVFQHGMSWRPWIYITGETDSGKTYFLEEVIEVFLGGLIKRADKTTAHAICQSIGNTSKILCVDEFEKSKHIETVMETLKLMSRGGEKNSGTPGEKEISFAVHHMPFLSSIYKPATCLKDESQRNRLITFELLKPEVRKPPELWSKEEAEEILTDALASVLPAWEEIESKSEEIVRRANERKQNEDASVDDRTVRNFKYICAVLELATGETWEVPTWAKTEKKSDGEGILETIVNSKVKVENEDYFISDLIDAAMRRPGENKLTEIPAKNKLRLYGITTVYRDQQWFLALRTEDIQRHLFTGVDQFKGVDISLPLERVAGAEKKKATFGKNSSLSALQIPMTLIDVIRGYELSQ